jgi:hypothetical protein
MRVIRAFAAGIGVGYLIWSGAGQRLFDKLRSMQQGTDASPASMGTSGAPSTMSMGRMSDDLSARTAS